MMYRTIAKREFELLLRVIATISLMMPSFGLAQMAGFVPVSEEMRLHPEPADWLMLNRTYDQQRYSALAEIDRQNVRTLALAWSRGLPAGTQETTPVVYRGVMYLAQPGASVIAIDATNGDQVWRYEREVSADVTAKIGATDSARVKNVSIFGDLIFYPAQDGFLVALDARNGQVRWETKVFDPETRTRHTGGVLVADGKVITNRACEQRAGCFIAAHDAKSGKEIWRFYNTAAPGTAAGETWGDLPVQERVASSWGLPGSYDPARRLTYWGIANPNPYTRLGRHGDATRLPNVAPVELYSNSTVALHVDTGELAWYYQHLPGDDWDLDHLHERTLATVRVTPNPAAVKWINPALGDVKLRDVVIAVGEGGGIWVLDRGTGEFLWATPFPYDVPEFHISDIDTETGLVWLNQDRLLEEHGDRAVVCFHNTRSFWSTAFDPVRNALYIPFHDNCLDMTANAASSTGFGPRHGILRPGADPSEYASIAKIDLVTGKMQRLHTQSAPGNGSALVTAGNLLFWGDMARRFRAFDADTGEVLWESILGGIVQTSTITYAAKGRQYVAVLTGNALWGTMTPLSVSRVETVHGHNAIYAFAIPGPAPRAD